MNTVASRRAAPVTSPLFREETTSCMNGEGGGLCLVKEGGGGSSGRQRSTRLGQGGAGLVLVTLLTVQAFTDHFPSHSQRALAWARAVQLWSSRDCTQTTHSSNLHQPLCSSSSPGPGRCSSDPRDSAHSASLYPACPKPFTKGHSPGPGRCRSSPPGTATPRSGWTAGTGRRAAEGRRRGEGQQEGPHGGRLWE